MGALQRHSAIFCTKSFGMNIEKALNIIKPQLRKDCQRLFDASEILIKQHKNNRSDSKPIISVYGLVNAGKSHLLNMLTNHIEQDFFKVADQRETTALKTFEMPDFIYLDTPGLDADDQDEITANEGVAQASVVMFVHQADKPLDAIEIEFLKQLQLSFGEDTETHLIIVLTQIDKDDTDGTKVQQIKENILNQCQEFLNINPTCFEVSSNRYKTGVLKQKQQLIQKSHIPDLQRYLQLLSISSAKDVLQRRLSRKAQQLILNIIEQEKALLQRIAQIEESIQKDLSPFVKIVLDFKKEQQLFNKKMKKLESSEQKQESLEQLLRSLDSFNKKTR